MESIRHAPRRPPLTVRRLVSGSDNDYIELHVSRRKGLLDSSGGVLIEPHHRGDTERIEPVRDLTGASQQHPTQVDA